MGLQDSVSTFCSPEEFARDLCRECAFPVPVDEVTVRQTHISLVFIGGDFVYKVKKPIKLPFLDFSTVELRSHYCHEEIRINRPWAPNVYLGVVPITRSADGLRFEGSGPAVDWAVKMRRLPESATLRESLQNGQLDTHDLARVTRRIAAIHRSVRSVTADQAASANAEFRRYWAENWEFARSLSADIVDPQVLRRLLSMSRDWLTPHSSAKQIAGNSCNLRLIVVSAQSGWNVQLRRT